MRRLFAALAASTVLTAGLPAEAQTAKRNFSLEDVALVIYPGQHHGIRKPSYVRDRLERYLAWYDKYAKTAKPSAGGTSTTAGR